MSSLPTMRRLLLVLPLLALLGCPQTPWCDRLNPKQADGLQTCIYADEVLSGTRPVSAADGAPVDFMLQEINANAGQDSLADGTRLSGQPWGVVWSVADGDPNATDLVDRIRRRTIRADSVGQVVTVEVAPDESHYALGLGDGRFLVRSADHETLLDGRVPDGVDTSWGIEIVNAVAEFAFSADARRVVTGDRQQNVDLWDPDGGGHLWHATLGEDIRALAVSADGRLVAAGSKDGTVTVWDATSDAELASWTHPRSVGHLAFTDDSQHVVVRLRGTYHAPSRPTASQTNPLLNSDEQVRRAQNASHDGYTSGEVVAVWRLP